MSDLLLAFFDRDVKGVPAAAVDGRWPEHPALVSAAPEALFKAREP